MTNPYGITLDRAWTEWAANYGVSPTVAAAVFLMSKLRPLPGVAAKLAAGEFEQVIESSRAGRGIPAWNARRPQQPETDTVARPASC